MKKLAAAVVFGCALLATGVAGATTGHTGSGVRAAAAPALNWGVADDAAKYADDGGSWIYGQLQGANLTENRWTVTWDPTHPTAINELPFLQRAAPKAQAAGIHVILALYGRPATANDPVAFCAWAANVAATAKAWGIHDFVVWNEPNTALFWSPQDDGAPAKYEALLAQCYDAIHAADSQARVIGFGLSPRSNGPSQTAPLTFLAGVGAAYKASGRQAPIMDQLSLHPYPNPNSPTDSPDVGYTVTTLLRRLEPRPRQAGGLRRLQRDEAAHDAERSHVPHRRARLADRHDEVPPVLQPGERQGHLRAAAGRLSEDDGREVVRLRSDRHRRRAVPARRRADA